MRLIIFLIHILGVGWYLKLEEWLPFIVDIFYYSTLTGSGKRTLGESYSNIVPVESVQRKLLLGIRSKRILWVILGVLIPHILKRKTKNKMSGKIIEILSESRLILFYLFGKFPSFTNRILSIRYVILSDFRFNFNFHFFVDFLSEKTARFGRRFSDL